MEEPSYTSRRSLLNLIIGLGLGGSLLPFGPAAATEAQPPGPNEVCPPETGRAVTVIDGDTLQLADGGWARLAGIEAPKRRLAPGDAAMAELERAATAALKAYVGSGPVTLCNDAMAHDRYGRRLAQAFNADGIWLQGGQISMGMARVHGDGQNRSHLRDLLGVENQARAARYGIWQHPAFAVRAADDPKLGRLAGSFQIVEGRVFAAATVDRTGFINFGADRHTDLTLVLKNPGENPVLDLGGPAMMDLSWLTAKPIRARGWLDLHDGPSIDISHAEQIELLET